MENDQINHSNKRYKSRKYLIVNADDYGYYDCVSKGILSAANKGVVTATGIFANSPFLEEHLHWLKQCSTLDVGVHLNLTDRSPLTSAMSSKLEKWDGCFPGKFIMASWILAGRLSLDEVAQELRAQIERCLAADLNVSFLNSHEHIHMLPSVFQITQKLAAEYGVPHVRYAAPDAVNSLKPAPLIRDIVLKMLSRKNRKSLNTPVLPFLGMAASGQLSLEYLRSVLSKLSSGVYELMCHPGACGGDEASKLAHSAYHNWIGELDVLMGKDFRLLCHQEKIELIGYRQTKIVDGQIKAMCTYG